MKDHAEIWEEWRQLVNMTPGALETWLKTEESNSVGDTKSGAASGGKTGGGESTGHKSGRHVIDIMHSNKDNLTADDWAHMGKVVGYIKRHLKQRPRSNVIETNWTYSLKNWGHDSSKD